jgi:hypothetical protein
MILRLEFGQIRSSSFPWVLRLCRQMPTFREYRQEDGSVVYSVEFTDKEFGSFEALWFKVCRWRLTALYMDGKLTSASEIFVRRNRADAGRRALEEKLKRDNALDTIDEL